MVKDGTTAEINVKVCVAAGDGHETVESDFGEGDLRGEVGGEGEGVGCVVWVCGVGEGGWTEVVGPDFFDEVEVSDELWAYDLGP